MYNDVSVVLCAIPHAVRPVDGRVFYPWHINWDNFPWLEMDETVEKPIVHQHDIAAVKAFVSEWVRPQPDPEIDAGMEAH